MATDKLDIQDWAEKSGLDVDFIRSHPAILALVRKAIKESWFDSQQGRDNFQQQFEQTPWFKANAKSARAFLMAEATNSADFQRTMETTRQAIRNRAVALGATLDDNAVETFARAYQMNGWGEPGREGFLDKALTGELPDYSTDHIDYTRGGPQAIITALRSTAEGNGVQFSDGYYEAAARSVMAGLRTADDFAAEIRSTAASTDPLNAQRIMAGESRRDIYSPYINTYAKMFDLDPNMVRLDDPNVKIAFNTTDDNGNPTAIGLWDYEKALRKTDGWQYTRDAHERIGAIVGKLGAMMGFGGSQ